MTTRKPRFALRTLCIAVRQGPHEIRESMVLVSDVNKWVSEKNREGYTTVVCETRRVPIAAA